MERPAVGVGVIVNKGGHVLMLQRKGEHSGGMWSFPGGHLEHMESWEDCARRELEEETGLVITHFRFVGVTNDIFPNGKHYITLFLEGEWSEGEAVNNEPNKCSAIDWFSWNALPKPLFLPIENLLKSGFTRPLRT